MKPQMQNPGWQAGASLSLCRGSLCPSITGSDLQAQMLASRFCLSPWMARDLARLCFGEGCHD